MIHESHIDYVEAMIALVPQHVDQEFKQTLKQNMLPMAKKAWMDHLMGETPTYFLTDDQLEQAWKKTEEDEISRTLSKLNEMGLVKVSVNDKGEIVYGITEDGESYIEGLKEDK